VYVTLLLRWDASFLLRLGGVSLCVSPQVRVRVSLRWLSLLGWRSANAFSFAT
jgi:hypothetical protein